MTVVTCGESGERPGSPGSWQPLSTTKAANASAMPRLPLFRGSAPYVAMPRA